MKNISCLIFLNSLIFMVAACLPSQRPDSLAFQKVSSKSNEKKEETNSGNAAVIMLQDSLNFPPEAEFGGGGDIHVSWISEHEVVFNHGDGRSIVYDFQTSSWSSPRKSKESTDFNSMYDFQNLGMVGIKDNAVSFRGQSKPIETILLDEDFKGKKPIGLSPSFLAFQKQNALSIFNIKDDKAQEIVINEAPNDLIFTEACAPTENCILRAMTKSDFFVINDDHGWTKTDRPFELDSSDNILNFAIKKGAGDEISGAVALLESGKILYHFDGETSGNKNVTWEQIRVLSSNYCEPCHKSGEDGYDKISTWTSLKNDIIARLSVDPNAKSAMPKAGSQYAKDFSNADRQKIIIWLNSQEATKRDEIGKASDPSKEPISGQLKILGEKHCVGCHDKGKILSWWQINNGKIVQSIKSGSMPKGKSLEEATKSEFYDILSKI